MGAIFINTEHPLCFSNCSRQLTPYLNRSTNTKVITATTVTKTRALMSEPLSFCPVVSPSCNHKDACQTLLRGGWVAPVRTQTVLCLVLSSEVTLAVPTKPCTYAIAAVPLPHRMRWPSRLRLCLTCPLGSAAVQVRPSGPCRC